MSDVKVNSVQPSEVGPEMVAYLLTVSILSSSNTSFGHRSVDGLPIILNRSEDEILRTYAKAYQVVNRPDNVDKYLGGS